MSELSGEKTCRTRTAIIIKTGKKKDFALCAMCTYWQRITSKSDFITNRGLASASTEKSEMYGDIIVYENLTGSQKHKMNDQN